MNELEPQEKRPEIDEQIRREAEAMTLLMGGDYNMTVGVGPWGSGWHWDFIKNHVNMDAKDLATEDKDVIKGVACHEGNHRLSSRAEHVSDLWQEPGFAYGFNAVEDPRANQSGITIKPGTREWIQAYIERDLSSGGGLDYEGIEKNTKNSLGYVPDYMKWGAEMIRYWHGKELSGRIDSEAAKEEYLAGIPDESVRELAEKTLDFFEEYYQTIPTSRDEMEVQKKAKESAQNFRDNIWPLYQELVEKSYQEHGMAKMAQDLMDQDQKQQSNKGQGQQQQGSGQQQGNSQEENANQEQNQGQSGQQSSGGGKQGEQKSQGQQQGGAGNKSDEEDQDSQGGAGSSGFPQLPEDVKNEISEKMSQQEDSSNGQEGSGKIPWDQLSEKAKEAIKDAYDKLPQDKKDEYQQEAKQELEDVEDEANEKLRGKMTDPRYTKTHKEEKEDQEQQDSKNQQAAESQRTSENMSQKMNEVLEGLAENPYYTYMQMPEVDSIRRQMERDFKKIFEPTEDPDVRHSSVGLRPSMRKAMQMEADPRRANIFESKGRPTEKKYRFKILVDLSSSMWTRGKIEETFKSLIPIVENFNRFGIECEIAGYSDNIPGVVKVFKNFEDKKLTGDLRNKIGGIMVDGGGSTPTSEATQKSYRSLKRRMTQVNIDHNYFITLTDGAPDEGPDALLKLINQIRKDKSIVTAGFGIGNGTEFVNESYPQLPDVVKAEIARELGRDKDEVSSSFDNASEFGRAFAIIIGYMIRRPELFK